MMKGLLCLLFLFLAAVPATAQQEATYAQYMFNGLAINPAYAGQHDALSVSALSRFQNVGLPGAPTTQTFAVHSPLRNQRFAVGALFVHDKMGVVGQTEFSGVYAYRIPVTLKSTLSFGIQAGFSRYSAQYSRLDLYQADPNFSQDIIETRPNIGAGVYYRNETWYMGLSMPHMLNNIFSRGNNLTTVKQSVPVILTGGYLLPLSRSIFFKPNALVKFVDNRIVELDLNSNFLFDDVVWFGVSYHSSKALNFLVDLQISDRIRWGYSYTAALGKIRTAEIGSHELFLGYIFKSKRRGKIEPRYF
jgi:type IX secretion system PorP/SprF family membrane protein